MGRQLLGYGDAVKLLGGECKVVTALSDLAGATLIGLSVGGVPAALGLFALKDEITRLSQVAVKVLHRRLTGLGRFKRSELLEAAHAILVVSAFFAALDDLDTELGTALNSASLELTKSEQAALATDSEPNANSLVDLARDLITPGRIPGLDVGVTDRGRNLASYYTALAHKVASFAKGTSVWDGRDEATRRKWYRALTKTLPSRALDRYQEQLVRLSGEFPEFAFWAHRVGIQVILDELSAAREDTTNLGITLQTAAKLLATAARGPDPEKVRADLVSRYRDQIAKSVAGVAAETIPDEVKLPSLQELYVTPSYRMLPWGNGGIERITESGWEGVSPCADLGAMVLEHLISTEATHVPLVLLGQPGAGKSVFSQMLAAELDPRDYLVVRVELRAVPSDAGIQEQIEAALAVLTGRSIRWPDLAEAAGNAQPVILLDGFDELLQASGVSHFDFLERVQAFQEREAELNRPVAVLVTSRTAVANQVRYPVGTSVARLEEFDNDQVNRWLFVWNRTNPTRPLAAETALAQGDLARQPLLLFLLALFHSGGGNLTPGISQAHLFERLFKDFVERDVIKLDGHLTDKQRQLAVQRDLDNLSMVAFAMFNRGRQSVNETDLIADLTALQPEPGLTPQSAQAAALTIAERMAGRFFFRLFLHRDEAMRGQQAMLSTYEFLHASFGEFLVGRWIVNELNRLGEQLRRTADDPYPSTPDDSKLHAVLSMTALSTREQRVLSFIEALLTEQPADNLTDLRKLISMLFRTSLRPRSYNPYPQYQPSTQTAPAAYAAYSANLVLLMLLIAQAESGKIGESSRAKVSVTELHASGRAPSTQNAALANFYAITRLWHAQLTNSEWNSLLDVVRVHAVRVPTEQNLGRNQEYEISLWEQNDRAGPISGYEILHGTGHTGLAVDYYVGPGNGVGRAFREAALLGATGYQGACTVLLPYLDALDIQHATGIFVGGDSAPASMLALLMPPPHPVAAQRAAIYEKLFRHQYGVHATRLLLGQLRDDIRNFTPTEIARIAVAATPYAWVRISAYLDIIAQVNNADRSQTEARRSIRGLHAMDQLLNSIRLPDARDLYVPATRSMKDRSGWRKAVNMVLDLSSRDLLTLLDPFSRREVDEQSELSALFNLLDVRAPEDVVVLVNLRDLFGLSDVRVMRDLHHVTAPSNRLDPSEQRRLSRWQNSPILSVALWTAMRQHGLPTRRPPAPVGGGIVKRLEAVVPNFVTETRQLAAEDGVADPLPEYPRDS